MMRLFFRRGLLAGSLLLLLHLGLSQQGPVNYATMLRQYRAAQRIYDRATLAGKLPGASEKEDSLNRASLLAFGALLNKLPARPLFDSLRFQTLFRVGELHHYFEDYGAALNYYNEAIALGNRFAPAKPLLFRPLLYAGLLYYTQNKFDSSASCLARAEGLQLRYGLVEESERLYNLLGVMNNETGNYLQAKNYFEKALEVLPSTHPYYRDLYVNYRINLAQIYYKLDDYNEANRIYQELLPFGKNINEINHNLGNINLSLGAAKKSLDYFRKVRYTGNRSIRLYTGMGNAFLNLRTPDSAEFYLHKALDVAQSFGKNTDRVGQGLADKALGDLWLEKGDPGRALAYYQKALLQFYPAYRDTAVTSHPRSYGGIFSYLNVFSTLTAKAAAFRALQRATGDRRAAESELDAYGAAFELMAYVERTYSSDEARLFLNKTKYAAHARPIDAAFALYRHTGKPRYLELLYRFDQQNKASVLSLQTAQAGEVTDSFLLRERLLKAAITRSSLQALQPAEGVVLAALQKTIRNQELELDRLQRQRPQLQRAARIPTVTEVQSLLDAGTLLLSYHLSDSGLTVIRISRDAAIAYQQALPTGYRDSIRAFAQSLKMPAGALEVPAGQALYRWLLGPAGIGTFQRLVIIPDDELLLLPFECLWANGKYLVETHSVQYQYATTLLRKEDADFSKLPALALAPFAHTQEAGFASLPASATEIDGWRGRKLVDGAATKTHFLQAAEHFPILHLATHAVAGPNEGEGAFIVFSPQSPDSLLYTPEIYNLSLAHTRLVLLSACETGSGQVIRGEGVMSLSRAFAYAGCPNIITSLWKADDRSTAYLARRFAHHLEQGLSVDGALRAAKGDYLADPAINPRRKQPFYWSHLVFIGNYAPGACLPWGWFVAGGLLLLAGLFFLLRKRNPGRGVRGWPSQVEKDPAFYFQDSIRSFRR